MANKHDYGSRFLYAEDLIANGQYVTATVEVSAWHEPGTIKAANGKMVDKPCVEFKGKGKMLALCKTNRSMGIFITGQQPGPAWIGKTLTLQPRIVDAFGEKVVAIRIVPQPGTFVRKSLRDRLGTKAELTINQKEPE